MYQVFVGASGTALDFVNGLYDAVDDGEKIINFSGGSLIESGLYRPAIQYALDNNVLVICAAGNQDLGSLDYPAALSILYDNLIAVSATDYYDLIGDFSSIGNEVTIAAPGVGIYSTMLPQTYGARDGTSYSAPYVTGVASLMYSVNGNLLPAQVKDILEKTALDIGDYGKDDYFGYGRLDAYRAVKATQILATYPGSKFITSSKSSTTYLDQDWYNLSLNGQIYTARRYKMDVTFNLNDYFSDTANSLIWYNSNGWPNVNPLFIPPPWTQIISQNSSSVTLRTYAYQLIDLGGNITWSTPLSELKIDILGYGTEPSPNIYNVNFQNNFVGVGNTGNIKVNGTVYTSPTNNFSVTQGNTINATAINQTLNYIDYSFSNWSNGSTNATTTFTPTANGTYTANFIGKASNANRGLHFINQSMQPITVLWNEHPNTNVTQYQIWRKVNYKKQGISSPALIGTVNRGTTSFVDQDYMGASSGFTDWMLYYDVKSYYAIEQTYSDDAYASVFSDGPLWEIVKDKTEELSVVKENSLDNYPNPFNPSTIIRYQIVKAGHVTLKVYDMLGREVANLVDKEQASGRYSVNFNASDLSSGIYLYRITANGFMAVKKMILLR